MRRPRFPGLTRAERAVLRGLPTGRVTSLGDGRVPGPEARDDRRVRASLIRWLALGAPGARFLRLHQHGLRIAGALIFSDGKADPLLGEASTPGVDLEGCKLDNDLVLMNCLFEDPPVMRGARVKVLSFDGAHLAGLRGDMLEARGSLFLRKIKSSGEVRLKDARIHGNLECDGGKFSHSRGNALNLQGARVAGTFFWRHGSFAKGALDLTAAEIGLICDDRDCWPERDHLLLNRCRYGAFTGQGVPLRAEKRIRWLDLQSPEKYGDYFWPQPWEHCAQVLREMGHAEDARQVLIAKEKRQRSAERARRRREVKGTWREMLLPLPRLRDGAFSLLIAYGHRPHWALGWLAVLWLIGLSVFTAAYERDGFKPNKAFILRSPEWAQCADGGDRRGDQPSTLDCYRDQPEAAGYPAFNAALYSLDTLVPVVDLEVQDYWVPDETVAAWARVYLWGHIAAGWFLALLAVAGFSGLVQTRSTSE